MITIIIPVYNGERFLDRCLTSVLGQTYKDLQVIVVNDGSADNTGAICDGWARADSRVQVIHQANAGVSAARNAALEAAEGEYIGFVDADDTIEPDTYARALEAMGDCDLVMWDAVTVWPDGRREPDTIDLLPESRVMEKKDWSSRLLQFMAGSACRCLYRRELLTDVRFPVGIKLSEDRLFNLEAMGKAKTLAYYKHGMYHRMVEEGSACHRYHGDRFEKALLATEIARQRLRQYWSEDYVIGYEKKFIIGGALDAIREICGPDFPGKNRRKAIAAVAAHPAVRDVFDRSAPEGLWERLLCKRMAGALQLLSAVARLKNR